MRGRPASSYAASLGENWGEIGSPANAPWVLGVAAVSHDRRFVSSLAGLAGGSNPPADLRSSSLTSSFGPTLVVTAGSYGSYNCSSPFPAGTFHGEIVVCDHSYYDSQIAKGQNVLAAGGGGMVLTQYYSYGTEPDAVPNVLPAVLLSPDDSSALWSWLSSGSGHSGRIAGTTAQLDPLFGDRLWPGSPAGFDQYSFYDAIKPDVAAPGREILAAHTAGYRILSGTSMAAAHAAGAAALLTVLHPGWTAAEIQSALTLTGAGVVEDDGNATQPLATGGGRLDLSAAARTGLVLDETPAHFDAADPGQGGSPKTLNLAGLADGYCVLSCGWARTVRSTLATPTQWTVTVEGPAGIALTVSPLSFSLAPGGSQSLQVTVTGSTSVSGWKYGRVTLSETGAHAPAVHFPLAAFFVPQYQLTVQKSGSGTGRVTSAPTGIDCGNDCTEYYPEDSYVTLTAVADPGSVFVGWGGYCYWVESTCQIPMYSQRLATAYFSLPAPDRALGNQVPFRDSLNGPVSRRDLEILLRRPPGRHGPARRRRPRPRRGRQSLCPPRREADVLRRRLQRLLLLHAQPAVRPHPARLRTLVDRRGERRRGGDHPLLDPCELGERERPAAGQPLAGQRLRQRPGARRGLEVLLF